MEYLDVDESLNISIDLLELASQLLNECKKKSVKITTAESCTGGLISALLTSIPGSSNVVERSFVTYSNDAKIDMVNVPLAYIEDHGAVSQEVCCAMAEGAIRNSLAGLSLAVTGIAGPDGGTLSKPVGLVYIACVYKSDATHHTKYLFSGNRETVRNKTVKNALELGLTVITNRQ